MDRPAPAEEGRPDGQHPPLVSVVITTYNQARYIANAIQSVFAQTYRPIEVIVVDDGSTDNTAQVVAPFGGQVRLIQQANAGVAGARNTGIAAASGALVALLDGDDEWEPVKIERQVDAFREHPDVGLIAVGVVQVDGDHTLTSESFSRFVGDAPTAQVTQTTVYGLLLRGNFIATTTQVMIPMRVLAEIGQSDGAFKVASDYDLYLRIAARYDFAFVGAPLARWRFLSTSVSGPSPTRRFTWGADAAAVLYKHQRSADQATRRVIRGLLKEKLWQLGADACYVGVDGQRMWASRMLVQLALACPRFPWMWLFLVGLWTPRAIRSAASRCLTATSRAA